ncbi:hypothetical protein HD554DRAFT_2040568 [Boletus coccyginus]|nr:hypothetical protein HD554DRAFT_2040568 [Boletus coccyginus]
MDFALIHTRYGIKPVNKVLNPLWLNICLHYDKGLAVFLKAIGFIIPLMYLEYASYTKEVIIVLIHKFLMSGEEMKIVLKLVKQHAATEGVTMHYIKQDILPDLLSISEIIVNKLRDGAESYQKMVMETIITTLGASDIKKCLDIHLEQTMVDQVMLDGFAHQQAADLITQFAVVIKQCKEDQLLSKLDLILLEQLGEEYPDMPSNIIAAEGIITNVIARQWTRIYSKLRNSSKACKKNIQGAWVLNIYFQFSLPTSETCGSFTYVPAILNEYCTAELNVWTSYLPALTFVFE